MEKLLYTGKAKQMWQTEDPDVLRVVYLDQATMLNGKRKDHFDGKGEAANDISTLVFEYLIDNGIPTHFIKRLLKRKNWLRSVICSRWNSLRATSAPATSPPVSA